MTLPSSIKIIFAVETRYVSKLHALLLGLVFSLSLLGQPGSVDTTFNVGTGFDRIVKVILLQHDGKILVGGEFKNYNGQPINGVARLHPDGRLDSTFKPKFEFTASVNAMAIQKDGKVIIGGLFMGRENGKGTFNPRNIARLNSDGTTDQSFNVGTGFSPSVYAITIQPDEKILVGGDFTTFNGLGCGHIIRLNKDGSLDPKFKTLKSYDKIVFSIALQPDGKIITSGRLEYLDYDRNKLVQRLNKDGSLDTTFQVGRRFTHDVWTIKLLEDGKILASGGVSFKDTMIRCIATRLNHDGSVDTSFSLPKRQGEQWTAYAFEKQIDGKIIIVGYFSKINGEDRRGVLRVNVDGSIDTSFTCVDRFTVNVKAMCIDASGRLIAAGAVDAPGYGDKKNISCLKLTSL